MSDFKVGDYYYFQGCLVEILGMTDDNILIGSNDSTYDLTTFSDLKRTSFYTLNYRECDNKNYKYGAYAPITHFEGSGDLTPAYRAIKDTALARKMYQEIYKEEGGYLYVRI